MLSRRSFALAFFGLGASTVIPGSPAHYSNLTELSPSTETETVDLRRAESLVFQKTNQLRRERRSLPAFDFNGKVEEAAREHAEDMAARDYFSHTSPEGETQQERYAWCGGGENAAKTWLNRRIETADGYQIISTTDELADRLVAQWLNSDPHRERGLFGPWSSAAPAIARSGDEIYAVLGFCHS